MIAKMTSFCAQKKENVISKITEFLFCNKVIRRKLKAFFMQHSLMLLCLILFSLSTSLLVFWVHLMYGQTTLASFYLADEMEAMMLVASTWGVFLIVPSCIYLSQILMHNPVPEFQGLTFQQKKKAALKKSMLLTVPVLVMVLASYYIWYEVLQGTLPKYTAIILGMVLWLGSCLKEGWKIRSHQPPVVRALVLLVITYAVVGVIFTQAAAVNRDLSLSSMVMFLVSLLIIGVSCHFFTKKLEIIPGMLKSSENLDQIIEMKTFLVFGGLIASAEIFSLFLVDYIVGKIKTIDGPITGFSLRFILLQILGMYFYARWILTFKVAALKMQKETLAVRSSLPEAA